MGLNHFSHIDLRVSDMEKALPFYSALMPELGFTRRYHSSKWKVFAGEGTLPSAPYFGLTEERGHGPNSNRIAFWVETRQEVDRIGAIIRRAGAGNIEGPRECPEYSTTYYAVFFEDPCGNRLEVSFRTN